LQNLAGFIVMRLSASAGFCKTCLGKLLSGEPDERESFGEIMATVLIVDDSLDVCKPVTRLLNHYGLDTEWVTSGEAALEYIRCNSAKVVLLDIGLPGISGFDVLRVMRSEPEFADMPVIMYTGRADEKAREEARRLGAQEFVTKNTVTFQFFLDMVRRHTQAAV